GSCARPTCALAFVPVERSLRPRVGFFAPLRDKVTSSAQSLVPPSGRPSQGSSLSILTEPHDELAALHCCGHSITSSARTSRAVGILRLSALAVFLAATAGSVRCQSGANSARRSHLSH